MESMLTALEMTGIVDASQVLHLDNPLPITGPKRVRVIVLYAMDDDTLDESEWLYAAAQNPAFHDLHDPAEDIYSITDGEPIRDYNEV